MTDLIKRLDIKAGMMEMGEKIAWGSDTALMREAIHEIESLRARLAEYQARPEWVAAGDGTLHGAIDHWAERAIKAEARLTAQQGEAVRTPQFTHNIDTDSNCLMIYLDGEEFVEYWCEHDPEDMVNELRRVFMAGMNYTAPQPPPAQQVPIGTVRAFNGTTVAVINGPCVANLKIGQALYAAPQPPAQGEAATPRFPVALRKMWSGGEVQAWIDANWKPQPPGVPDTLVNHPHNFNQYSPQFVDGWNACREAMLGGVK